MELLKLRRFFCGSVYILLDRGVWAWRAVWISYKTAPNVIPESDSKLFNV